MSKTFFDEVREAVLDCLQSGATVESSCSLGKEGRLKAEPTPNNGTPAKVTVRGRFGRVVYHCSARGEIMRIGEV